MFNIGLFSIGAFFNGLYMATFGGGGGSSSNVGLYSPGSFQIGLFQNGVFMMSGSGGGPPPNPPPVLSLSHMRQYRRRRKGRILAWKTQGK